MTDRMVQIPQNPLVVGSVQSLNDLACLPVVELPGLCDMLEIRLDGMFEHMSELQIELDRFKDFPLLFTARCANEGGLTELSSDQRAELLMAVAERASWIDVELASCAEMQDTLHQISSLGVGLILSYHNFTKTPEAAKLQNLVEQGEVADIIKIAVHHQEVSDLARCVEILQSNHRPMSMMGMGQLGPVSRLLYAQHGSLLNYGYLGSDATAPGQWPAKLLREAIAKLEPIA